MKCELAIHFTTEVIIKDKNTTVVALVIFLVALPFLLLFYLVLFVKVLVLFES